MDSDSNDSTDKRDAHRKTDKVEKATKPFSVLTFRVCSIQICGFQGCIHSHSVYVLGSLDTHDDVGMIKHDLALFSVVRRSITDEKCDM